MGICHNNRFRVDSVELRNFPKEIQKAVIGAPGGSHNVSRGSAEVIRQAVLDVSHWRSGFYDLWPHKRLCNSQN